MRALALLIVVLAGCRAEKAVDPRPAEAAKANADVAILAKALADARADLQAKLDRLDKLSVDWHGAYSAQLANVADDTVLRDKLMAENEEFNAKNAKMERELHETYEPIIADLERRHREAVDRSLGKQPIKHQAEQQDR